MAQQVKFYSMSAGSFERLDEENATTSNGIYFVDNGELYKGSQRFGALKVRKTTDILDPNTVTDLIGGDINVVENGDAYAYDGTSWIKIATEPTNVINDLNFSEIGDSTGTTSIVTSIKQENGQVTATAKAFPTLTSTDAGKITFNGSTIELNGWSSLTSRVSDLETWQDNVTGDDIVDGTKLTAESGKFKNLTVTDTATFSATTVDATTLSVATEDGATFGDLTISAIADRQISLINEFSDSASSNGVTVGVVTQSGSLKDVTLTITGATTSTDFTSTNANVATAQGVVDYVTSKMADVVAPMNFIGVKTSLPASGKNGDVVIVGTKEYVYDSASNESTKWVELGDESELGNLTTFTGYNATNPLTTTSKNLAGAVNELDAELGTITATAMGTTASTVSGAIAEIDAKVDTLTGEDTVEGSVKKALKDAKAYTDAEIQKLDATVKDAESGEVITIVETDGKLASVTVSKSTAIAATDASDAKLATEKAVRDAITSAELVWLDAGGHAIA